VLSYPSTIPCSCTLVPSYLSPFPCSLVPSFHSTIPCTVYSCNILCVQAIENFPEPTNLKETQRLLGMLCYLAAFIPHYSTRLFPVFQLLKNANAKTFQMTKELSEMLSEPVSAPEAPVLAPEATARSRT
jgi:hypothetical protein